MPTNQHQQLNSKYQMTKSLFSVAMGSFVLANSSFAGTTTSEAAPMASAPSASGITGSVAAGYDSEYYFRGLWFSSNNAWGSVNLAMPVADKLTLGLGAYYTNGLDTTVSTGDLDYSELDLIGSLTYDADWGKVGLVVTNYRFFQSYFGEVNGATIGDPGDDSTISDTTDIGLTFAIPVGAMNVYAAAYYDVRINAPYFEVGADYTYALNDKFSIVPAAQLGYAGNNYFTFGGADNDFTHLRLAVSAPYKFTDALTFTPYVAYNISLEARRDINSSEVNEDDFYAGAALSYSF
jgi:hypothetical protein